MADWGILQPTPNFAQAALSGYQAGAAIGKQRQLDEAMAGIDLTKPETLLPLLRADPSTGAALIGASVKLHAEDRAQQAQQAIGAALGNYFGAGSSSGSTGSSGSASSDAPAAPTTPPITASPTPANPLAPSAAPATGTGDIVVNAPHPVTQMAPNLQQTVGKLLAAGVPLDQATQFVDLAGKMTKTQADALSDQQDAIGTVAAAVPRNLSLQDRGQWILQHKDFLLSHNVQEAKIDEAAQNPTDENLQAIQSLALGTKDAMTQVREAAAQAETARHNQVDESQGSQRIGIEAQNAATSAAHLGIDRAQLGLAQQKFKLTSGGGSASGSVATPSNAAEYKALPAGARYFKNGQIFVKGGGQ